MTRTEAFNFFLKHFSNEKLPVTLSDETIHYFDSKNRVLNDDVIRQFIQQGESEEKDDYTEYIACNYIPNTKDFHAVIYWKGSLLSYDFILATFNKNGILISKKVIAGVRSDGLSVHRSVATIDEDWIITIVTGSQIEKEGRYDPLTSQHVSMELLPNGEIIFSLQE